MTVENPDFYHEIVRGICVVTFVPPITMVCNSERHTRLANNLYSLIEGGVGRVILDFTNVKLVDAVDLSTLMKVAGRLCGTDWSGFTICPDREAAMDVISNPKSVPLILCSVSPVMRQMLRTVGLYDGPD